MTSSRSEELSDVEQDNPSQELIQSQATLEEVGQRVPNHTVKVPPDGGSRAWLVALGAFAAMFCTFGYLNSFG